MSQNNQFNQNLDLFSDDIDESYIDTAEVYKEINKIYDSVIESFRLGNFKVYRPDIFYYLDRQKFTDWILQNNSRLATCK